MSYDPCGTQHLDGDDIIARLADYLKLDDDAELKNALILLIQLYRDKQEGKEIVQEFRDSY